MKKRNSYWICFIMLLPLVFAHPHGFDVAKESLQLNYDEYGITAGRGHFSDVWARDAFFASLGSNRIGDYTISKKTLETFIKHQAEDGQIPLRVGDRFIQLKFIGLHTNGEYPTFDQDKGKTPALDPNCLFIIATHDYVEQYGDWSFIRTNYDSFTKALIWLEQYEKNSLLQEDYYGNWADSLKKEGSVLYTNVCYYKALKDMSAMAQLMVDTEQSSAQKGRYQNDVKVYTKLANDVKKSLQTLYNGQYFIDGNEIDGTRRKWFSTDGNTLAIIWDVANKTQAKSIIDYAKKTGMEDSFSVELNYPDIPSNKKSLFIRLAGIKDYHDGMLWPWLGAMYCLAKEKTYEGQGEPCLNKISKVYDEQGVVKEVYEDDATPVNRLFYNSEKYFAWGAGLFIYAHEEMGN